MKLAVLFPGIGYTCTKPLLYYAGKLAAGHGYEVVPVAYGDFPKDAKGDARKMQRCFTIAYEQAEAALREIRWGDFDDILFIGKSIGTTVAAQYAREHGVPARLILLTPLAETFRFTDGNAIAFHGTGDPWAATSEIVRACGERKIPLYLTDGANHSLETGDVRTDLATLAKTMEAIDGYIKNPGAPGWKQGEPELYLELQDGEWPLEYTDHDRKIVRAIVVDDAGMYYFVRASRDDEFGSATLIETSGGGVEPGEDLEAAIQRELREELGAEVDVLRKIGVVSDYYNLIHRHNINHYFLCRIRAFGDKHLTEDEIDKYHLSTLKLGYDEAVAEYERRSDTRLGRLIANRELPILKRAKALLS